MSFFEILQYDVIMTSQWEHPAVTVEEVKGYEEPLRYIGQFLLLVEQSLQRSYLRPPLRDKSISLPTITTIRVLLHCNLK